MHKLLLTPLAQEDEAAPRRIAAGGASPVAAGAHEQDAHTAKYVP